MFSSRNLIIAILMLASVSWMHATTYKLQAVRSKEVYGPFSFKPNTYIKIESGIFQLKIISGRTFKLVASDTNKAYGVYELLPGRIIDVGDVLFTVTDIKTPKATPVASNRSNTTPAGSVFSDTTISLEFDLLNTVEYDWSLNGADASNAEKMERNSATLRFKRKLLTGRLGLITAGDWDNTVDGTSNTFQNATLVKGTGWIAGLGIEIPVLTDGRWKASIFGELSYKQEELSLQYSESVLTIISSVVTNGTSNIVTTATNREITNHSDDATLTEIAATLGANISYTAPRWFIYGGIKVLPWVDTALDAKGSANSSRFKIEFERQDPVIGYGGIGLNLANTKCYVEMEGGGETAIRLGILMEL